jgi:hypothetical protein
MYLSACRKIALIVPLSRDLCKGIVSVCFSPDTPWAPELDMATLLRDGLKTERNQDGKYLVSREVP